MIRFNELTESKTESDVPQSFTEQKESRISHQDSQSYWDNLYESLGERGGAESALLSPILDWDEKDLMLESYDVENEISSIMDEVRDNWEDISEDRKQELLESFAEALSEILELESTPQLTYYYDDDRGDCGFYNPEDNTVNLNFANLDNPGEMINTVAHEMRHAYQEQRANIGETYTDKMYRDNFENYQSPQYVDGNIVNFFEYYCQFVEVDARAFADQFKL